MRKLLCPSMMCADFGNLEHEIDLLTSAGADLLHVDIMDGSFVPNFGMGLGDAAFISKTSNVPIDLHLMIQNPAQHISLFAALHPRIIYIHPEADQHPTRTLQLIKDQDIAPGIAINPGTAIATITPLLHLASYVLVMTVNPGFAGQTYLPFVTDKIMELAALKADYKFSIIIDGACSPDKIDELGSIGADGFVLGTAALFGKDRPYGEIIKELRSLNPYTIS